MATALIDTNVLIDYFAGLAEAHFELGYYDDLAISLITYMEFMIGLQKQARQGVISAENRDRCINAVRDFHIIPIDESVAECAINLRTISLLGQTPKIALPDALIFASALIGGRYLVTRDRKGFSGPYVREPYRITATGSVVDVAATPPD